MYLRKKKVTPQTVKYFSRSVEDFASHTERLTMHLLATPRIKKMDGVDLNSEDVGATGIGCQNLTYWICSE
jgi:hypothetical protein